MPLLIEGLCPQLTADVISECKSVGIYTVTDFVSSDTEELSKKSKIPYKDLVYIRHNLLSTYACFPQRADSLYAMLLQTVHIINTGSKRTNSLLKGGIYTGEVTEFYGPSGSGKTQFCLSIGASLLSESGNNVLYLDSNCNFAASRIEEILMARCGDKEVVSKLLNKIRIINIQNVYHLFDILDKIKYELHNLNNTFFKHLKLIVLDSITHHLSSCFGGKYLDGPGFMGNIAHLFKILSSEHMISIVVTNNTVQSENQVIKAGLGVSWKYVPSVSLCIRKLNENKMRKLTVIKSCRKGLNESTFCITKAGIGD